MSLRNQPRPEDQRNLIIATVLVAIVTFVWMYWLAPQPQPAANQPTAATDTVQTAPDTSAPSTADPSDAPPSDAPPSDAPATADVESDAPGAQTEPPAEASGDPALVRAREGDARTIVVESDLYTATFSTKGATLTSFVLKEYKNYDGQTPVQLVDTTGNGALGLAFTTPQSHLADSRSFYFSADVLGDTLRVDDDSTSLTFAVPLGEGQLRQTYTFQPGSYEVGLRVEQRQPRSFATEEGYDLFWDGGMPFTEGGTETEVQRSGVFAHSGGEVVSVIVSSEDHNERRLNGDISWLAVKNKYFAASILPESPERTRGAELVGDRTAARAGDEAEWRAFVARLFMPQSDQQVQVDRFHLYLGPLDYYNLASYDRDLYDMVDYGWDFFEWMTRPLAKYMFIPLFTFLHGFIPNYGIVIILLALFVKLITYPLTKSSYTSMAKMRELQPQMQEIKDKYGDKPQKQQEEMMKLYQETGVNPLGGCLPMFLQYPIIIALYQFLPQSIEVRQQSFLWAADLSAPDKILQLPFTIPVYGDYVAGFTLLMGIAMIFQMRLQTTPGSGSQAKMFQYMMPGVIFFIFNQFASALSLYYLFYNVISALQQKWIYYRIENEEDEDDARSNGQADQKDSFFTRLLKKAEEAQKQQR